MWYDSVMPKELPKEAIDAALAAIEFAQLVRRQHRRRTGRDSAQRRTDIELALTRLKEAMGPLRSEIGRFPYGPQTTAAEANRDRIRDVSAAIQRERRKLWKMRTPQPEEAQAA
jgi:hypothetical protein